MATGVKIDTPVSVRASGSKSVALVGDRTADIKLLKVGHWVKNRILPLRPRHYAHRLFAKIGEWGGFFVSRLKESADPLFVRSLTVHRGRATDLEGKRRSDVLPRLRCQTLYAEVVLSVRRWVYDGRRPGDALRCRLVAVWNEEKRPCHLYPTNIAPGVLSAEEAASLSSMGWEVELGFRELKSQSALDEFRTTNANIVEARIWSARLRLVAGRRWHNLVRGRAPPTLRPRSTQMLWAIHFREAGM